jgi:transposase InsO family protein
VRYGFVKKGAGRYPVSALCRSVGVSTSGYYGWCGRPESERVKGNRRLLMEIREIHEGPRRCYGSPRVHEELMARGIGCSRGRVERLMRVEGIRARYKRRWRATTDSGHGEPVAPDLLGRQFDIAELDRVWMSDITFIWTEEGWEYLAAVLDACSRRVVGWAMDRTIDRGLVLAAVERAIRERCPERGLVHHSDRGRQYASADYRTLLSKHGMICSMSRKGDCWGNAVAESFFHSLKAECVSWKRYRTREEARQDVFRYIELFYNRARRHSSLGYASPEEFERRAAEAA